MDWKNGRIYRETADVSGICGSERGSARRALRMAQALVAYRARSAYPLGACKLHTLVHLSPAIAEPKVSQDSRPIPPSAWLRVLTDAHRLAVVDRRGRRRECAHASRAGHGRGRGDANLREIAAHHDDGLAVGADRNGCRCRDLQGCGRIEDRRERECGRLCNRGITQLERVPRNEAILAPPLLLSTICALPVSAVKDVSGLLFGTLCGGGPSTQCVS